jgi:hypothetical protein
MGTCVRRLRPVPRQGVLWDRHLYVLQRSQPAAFSRHLCRARGAGSIADGSLIRGELPKTAARLVEQWRQLHVAELNANWTAAQLPSTLTAIEPLQ